MNDNSRIYIVSDANNNTWRIRAASYYSNSKGKDDGGLYELRFSDGTQDEFRHTVYPTQILVHPYVASPPAWLVALISCRKARSTADHFSSRSRQ